MPAKGSKLLCGKRIPIIDKSMFNVFKLENKDINMSLKEYTDICNHANLLISECILKEPLGFKLPYFGYIAVNRFKSNKKAIDVNSSRIYKKEIPFLNMHTMGYRFAIKFFKVTDSSRVTLVKVFKYNADRKLKRKLAALLKSTGGEQFLNMKTNHYITKSAISKYILNKL